MPYTDHAQSLACKARYREKHREELRRKGREYARRKRAEDPEASNAKAREYRASRPGYASAITKAWGRRYPDKRRALWRNSCNNRRKRPDKNLHHRIAVAVRTCLKGLGKSQPTFDLLGYSCGDLTRHLESKFLPGMSWENFGEWHIDHVKPLALFIITSDHDAEFREAWSLKNLQPLWAIDNLRKGAKYLENVSG